MEVTEALHVFEDLITLMTGMWSTPLIKLRWISRNGAEAWAKLRRIKPEFSVAENTLPMV